MDIPKIVLATRKELGIPSDVHKLDIAFATAAAIAALEEVQHKIACDPLISTTAATHINLWTDAKIKALKEG